MYCRPTCSYSTTPTFSTLGFSSISPPSRRLDGESTGRPLSDQLRTRASVMLVGFASQAGRWPGLTGICLTNIVPVKRVRRHEDEGRQAVVVLRAGGVGGANGLREDPAGVSTAPRAGARDGLRGLPGHLARG